MRQHIFYICEAAVGPRHKNSDALADKLDGAALAFHQQNGGDLPKQLLCRHLSGGGLHLQARVWCLLTTRHFSWQSRRALRSSVWTHWNHWTTVIFSNGNPTFVGILSPQGGSPSHVGPGNTYSTTSLRIITSRETLFDLRLWEWSHGEF